jgi:lysophospholipase L1-like esterase
VTTADAIFVECQEIARGAINHSWPDPTRNSDSYYDLSITPPAWAIGLTPRLNTGRMLFYGVELKETPAPPVAAASVPTPSVTSGNLICCYGDSTVRGLTTNGRWDGPKPGADGTVQGVVEMPWPAGLQALLRDQGVDVTVENWSVSGTTCTNWLNGTGGVPRSWQAEMTGSTAALSILCLGINDAPTELAQGYPQMLSIAKAAGRALLVVTPNQILTGYGGVDSRAATIIAAASQYGFPIADVFAYTNTLPDWARVLSYSVVIEGYWSGIHPTQPGYDLIAGLIAPIAAGIVKPAL